MRKSWFCFLNSRSISLILLLTANTFAPGKVKAQAQIEPRYLSIAEGLSSPTVNDVFQDSYGIIWIATANGLHKYDGFRMEVIKNIPGDSTSLPDNQVWGISEDTSHNLWIGTDIGTAYYNRRSGKFKYYDLTSSLGAAAAGKTTFVIKLDSRQRVYALTNGLGVLEYNPKSDTWTFPKYSVPGLDSASHFHLTLAFTEDSKGGIWIGSLEYGLMYRAINGDAFRPVPQVRHLFSSDVITALYTDSTGVLWITSRKGVYKFYPATGELKTIKTYTEAAVEILNHWNCIAPDPAGNIWISNNFRGILKFDGISDRYEEVSIAGKLRMKTYGWTIALTRFIVDHSGIMWFGSDRWGLVKYDPVSKPFTHLSPDSLNPNSIRANGVYGILASKIKPRTIYLGTRGSGMSVYNTEQQTFKTVRFKAVDDMFGGSVRAIAEDNDGTIWLGTWGDGLIKMDKNYREITRYKNINKNQSSITDNQVRVLKRDPKGRLWVGTNIGLNIFNDQTQTFQQLASETGKIYPPKITDEVEAMLASKQVLGKINQVGNIQNKSQEFEIKTTGSYVVVAVSEGDPVSIADIGWIEKENHDTIWKMPAFRNTRWAGGDAKNRIAIASLTLQPGKYMLRFKTDDSHAFNDWNAPPPDLLSLYGIALIQPNDEEQGKRLQSANEQAKKTLSISNENITSIAFTDDYAWIATPDGLNRIDMNVSNVKVYQFDPANKNSISSSSIREVFADKKGMIWLATSNGICKINPATDSVSRYTEHDGLPTNLTENILEGDNGEIWIGTQSGLSQMVTNQKLDKVTFINYSSADGIGGDVFLALTATRDPDGKFYFGGEHGLTTFNNIASNKTPPLIVLSNLLISNKSVLEMGDKSPVTGNVESTENIRLSFDQNNISFEFAALHYTDPQKNQYAHMLKGYDKDWIYDNRNFASYTNLDPGEYEFIVRASNAFGVWNETGKSIHIVIQPPWWRTWWAYSIYALSFLLLSYLVYGGMRRQIRLREIRRNREKELLHAKEIEKAYAELKATQSQLIQSEKMASLGELTAGIAHEIQNPLNFINNFSEVNAELIAEMKEEISKGNMSEVIAIADDIFSNEEKISHHGKRADAIVKGMLQHSRTGNSTKELTDINALCDEYLRLSYHGLRAKDKSFNAKFETDFDNSIEKVNVVPQDIGRVVLNLINNAFYAVNEKKTLPEVNGNSYEPTVIVSTKKIGDKILISVKDNGNGVPQHVLDKIFQPFFTTKPTGQGTGLGLSLSYDIVKAHGGELTVSSKQNQETQFTIILPTT